MTNKTQNASERIKNNLWICLLPRQSEIATGENIDFATAQITDPDAIGQSRIAVNGIETPVFILHHPKHAFIKIPRNKNPYIHQYCQIEIADSAESFLVRALLEHPRAQFLLYLEHADGVRICGSFFIGHIHPSPAKYAKGWWIVFQESLHPHAKKL